MCDSLPNRGRYIHDVKRALFWGSFEVKGAWYFGGIANWARVRHSIPIYYSVSLVIDIIDIAHLVALAVFSGCAALSNSLSDSSSIWDDCEALGDSSSITYWTEINEGKNYWYVKKYLKLFIKKTVPINDTEPLASAEQSTVAEQVCRPGQRPKRNFIWKNTGHVRAPI